MKNKAINGWGLFWLISGPISIAMLLAMARIELSSGPAISSMIQLSVRCAVPCLYLAFAASSVQALFPGPFSLWLMRNRKYLGLCFAAAMAWQGLFILWMVTVYRDYYVNEVYVLRDAIEGTTGYLFLLAMTVTGNIIPTPYENGSYSRYPLATCPNVVSCSEPSRRSANRSLTPTVERTVGLFQTSRRSASGSPARADTSA